MPKPIIVEGRTYYVPDDATMDEVLPLLEEIIAAEGRSPAPSVPPRATPRATPEALRAAAVQKGYDPTSPEYRAIMAHAERMEGQAATGGTQAAQRPTELRAWQPASIREAADQEAAQSAAQAAVEGRERVASPSTIAAEREAAYQAARAEIDAQRNMALIPASDGVQSTTDRYVAPPFRPSRLRELPTYRPPKPGMSPEEAATYTTSPIPMEEDSGEDLGEVYGPDGMLKPIGRVTLYRDPDTGLYREASLYERGQEAFAQQPILTEEEARSAAARSESITTPGLRGAVERYTTGPTGVLSQWGDRGEGVIESPLGATTRGVLGVGSAIAGETIFGENDVSFPLTKAMARILLPEGNPDAIPERQDPYRDRPYDPEGTRVASSAPTAPQRIIENLTAGRTLMDEFSDNPGIRATLGEDGAWWAGLAAEMLAPANIGIVTKPVGAIAEATGAGARASRAATNAYVVSAISQDVAAATARVAPGKSAAVGEAMRAARPATVDEAREVLTPILGPVPASEVVAGIRSTAALDEPMVAVTEAIAVPRSMGPRVREAMQRRTAQILTPRPQEIAARVEDLARGYDGVDDVLAARLRGATASASPRPLRSALASVDATRGVAKGTTAAEIMQSTPLDLVGRGMLPPRIDDALAGYGRWDHVPRSLQEAAVDAIRSKAAMEAVDSLSPGKQAWARTTDVAANMMSDTWRSFLGDSRMARDLAARLGGPEGRQSAAMARTMARMRAAGQQAQRAIEADLKANVREYGTIEGALEHMMGRIYSAEQGNLKEGWQKIAESLYGPQAQALAPQIDHLASAGMDITYGTVGGLMAAARELDLVGAGRAWSVPPRLDRRFLKIIAEEGVKKAIARDVRDADALIHAIDGERIVGQGWGEAVGAAGGDITLPTPAGYRVYRAADSLAEQRLAQAFEDLPQMLDLGLDSAPINAAAKDMAASAAEWAFGGMKKAYMRSRRGWVLPNLPLALGRLAEMAILPYVTLGSKMSWRSYQRAIGQYAAGIAGYRRYGGITAVDGVHYTPQMIADLKATHGIGYSMLDAERVGMIADDMLDEARKVERMTGSGRTAYLRGAAGRVWSSYGDPTQRGFWARMAESMEMTLREQIFEDALRGGAQPSEAARLAREALIDYGDAPTWVRETVAQYLPTAAHQYGLLSALAESAIARPELARAAAKGMRAQQQAADPYGLDGDLLLRRMGVTVQGSRKFYGPEVGLFARVDDAIHTMRTANVALSDVITAVERGDIEEIGTATTGGITDVATALVGAAVPGMADVVRAWQREAGAQATGDMADQGEEQAFWAALIMASLRDPTHSEGTWAAVDRILQPVPVAPPPEYASPVDPMAWRVPPPPGTPYIAWGRTLSGSPLYYSYRPSDTGLENLKIIRALTPDRIEALAGAASAAIIEEGYVPSIHPGSVMPDTLGGAILQGAGLPSAPSSSEEGRRAQINRIREIKED